MSRTTKEVKATPDLVKTNQGLQKLRELLYFYPMEKLIKSSKIRRKRKHGFLYRANTRSGRKVIKRRTKKGRKRIIV